ncbi:MULTISPECIES: histidine kinase [unclassified Mycolicibacterium]|uniref:histidine kinase n=1 Tax=unclassified Mycolicibacterium TaxID=2636767 RepID=UPI002ED97A6C
MDLQPYVDAVRHELAVAAAAGGADAEALAQRLTAPLDSALRLALLEALSGAAEQITRELAPGAVHVRLNGRDPEFSVEIPEPTEAAIPLASSAADILDDDAGGTWRVTLRLPENLRAGVEAAARGEGISVNAWLVRSVSAGLGGSTGRTRSGGKSFSGWVR